MKSKLSSILLTLTFIPFFGYSNTTQKTTTKQLLAHLQAVKEEMVMLLNDAQTEKNDIIKILTEHDPEGLRNMEAVITAHFKSNLGKEYLFGLAEHIFSKIYKDMKSAEESLQIELNPQLQQDENNLQEKLNILMDTFVKEHPQVSNINKNNFFPWQMAIDEFEMFTRDIIIMEMILQKIENKIKEIESPNIFTRIKNFFGL